MERARNMLNLRLSPLAKYNVMLIGTCNSKTKTKEKMEI